VESCLIADDHALVRDALSLAVAARWTAATIWEAADFPAAWELAAHQPALCLMDLGMAGAEPRQGISRIRAIAPASRVLVITGIEDDVLMLDLLDDGVAGFLSKSARTAVVVAALAEGRAFGHVELVLAGGRYLPPRLAEILNSPARGASSSSPLSARQTEVLRLIGDGRTSKEIGRDLAISPATVKVHIAQAMSALGATNRTDAAMKARALGVI